MNSPSRRPVFKEIVCGLLGLAVFFVLLFSIAQLDSNWKRERLSRELSSLRQQINTKSDNSEAVEIFSQSLNSAYEFERVRACTLIKEIDFETRDSFLDQLISCLDSGIPAVEREAARAIGSIGPRAWPATDFLTRKLKNSQSDVSWFAAEALGKIGNRASSALPELEQAAACNNSNLRYFAKRAIDNIEAAGEGWESKGGQE